MGNDGGQRRRTVLGAASLLLALLGLVALVIGVRGQDAEEPRPPQPPAATASAEPTGPEPAPRADSDRADSDRAESDRGDLPADLTYSPPVRIQIPSIGVDSSLIELGLDSAGVMETPGAAEVQKAGWFRPSPPPGIPGATVIAGHVTWDREPAVFFELGALQRGDRVDVVREDGVVAVFEVTRIGSFAKDRFPTRDVYAQPEESELRLITCGGEYDEESRRYLDNVIVWAKLVELRP